jgi:ABC-type transport system involved in multi-copper enzyme maturation permease subunit
MSDWLSPILVKELRQGMRARAFEGAFVLLQVGMVIAVSVAVLAAASNKGNNAAEASDVLFWAMVGLPVVLIMPMRGGGALRSEIDGRTLELIFLTRLSSWRIVFGKWAALFSQTLLMVVAVLPYVVVRYYLGGTEVVRELVVIAAMIFASALLTAFTVAGSAFPSKLARGLMVILPLALLYGGAFGLAAVVGSFGPSRPRGLLPPVTVLVALAFYGTAAFLFLLETGAARIAPPAENHALRKRILGLAVILSGPVALAAGADEEILLLNLALVAPVLVDALCAPHQPMASHLRPLLRLGRAGRYLAPLFLPGWPSGLLYTLFVFLLCLVPMLLTGMLNNHEVAIALVGALGTLTLPLALVLLVRPRTERLGVAYLAIQLVTLIVTFFALLIFELFDLESLALLSVSPMSSLCMALLDKTDAVWLVPTSVVTFCALLLVFSRYLPARRLEKAVQGGRSEEGAG